ncbi:MAG: hypothetical protein ACMXX9_03645 [Candidatus Woesearchaeota archaeon]
MSSIDDLINKDKKILSKLNSNSNKTYSTYSLSNQGFDNYFSPPNFSRGMDNYKKESPLPYKITGPEEFIILKDIYLGSGSIISTKSNYNTQNESSSKYSSK